MFLSNFKRLGLVFCVMALSSCGMFQSDKELPKGTRVAIVKSKYEYNKKSEKTISSLPAMIYNNNWSQFNNNSSHVTGNLSGNDNMKKVWEISFGKGSNKRNLLLAQPLILNGVVYTQDVNATISAFDIKNGQKVWKRKIKPEHENIADNGLNGVGIGASENKIFALTGFGRVVAFDATTGKEIWQENLNTPLRIAPSICGNKLIIQTLDNQLIVLNVNDGSVIWKYNTSAEDTVLAGGAVPACNENLDIVVAGFSNGTIEAFNANIGYPLWSVDLINKARGHSTTNINAVKASPLIDNNTIYAIGHNDMFVAVNYRSGETLWSQEIGGINTPWLAGDYLYVLTNNNELVCLNKHDGEIMFSTALLNEYELKERTEIYLSGPIMVNNKLLVSASNGIVYVISPLNGNIDNRFNIKEDMPFAPISADDTIIFTTDNGSIIAYK